MLRRLPILLLLLALVACGGATTPDDSTGGTNTQPSGAVSASPASENPSDAPSVSPEPVPSSAPESSAPTNGGNASVPDELGQRAIEFLTRETAQPASAFTLESAEPQEWSDGSLGCPAPDQMYTQALVSGYLLRYTDGSTSYELHTNENGSNIVWCENGSPRG